MIATDYHATAARRFLPEYISFCPPMSQRFYASPTVPEMLCSFNCPASSFGVRSGRDGFWRAPSEEWDGWMGWDGTGWWKSRLEEMLGRHARIIHGGFFGWRASISTNLFLRWRVGYCTSTQSHYIAAGTAMLGAGHRALLKKRITNQLHDAKTCPAKMGSLKRAALGRHM